MSLRINTLWCQFLHEIEPTEKPNVKEVFNWIFNELPQYCPNIENDLNGIQNEPDGFFLKFNNQEICDQIVSKLNGEGKIKKEDHTLYKIRIELASIGVRMVRVLRLPFELNNIEIRNAISKFGHVLTVEDEYWSANFTPHVKRYKNGTRAVKCNLNSHIPSFVYINGYRAMIQYDGQPKTCSYCGSNDHLIAQCTKSTFKPRSYSSAITGAEPSFRAEEVPFRSPMVISPKIPTIAEDITPSSGKPDLNHPGSSQSKTPKHRIHTSSTDETNTETPNEDEEQVETVRGRHSSHKKKKTETEKYDEYAEEIVTNLKPYILENQSKFILTPREFQYFIQDTKTKEQILTLSREYTNNTQDFLNMLEVIHENSNHKGLKSKLKYLIDSLITEMEFEALSKTSVSTQDL